MTPVTLVSQGDITAALMELHAAGQHEAANMLDAYIKQLLNTIDKLTEHLELERNEE